MVNRSWCVGLALVLLVGCSNDDEGSAPPPSGTIVGPLVAGRGGYSDGVFVWTDYAYDDRGANLQAAEGGDRDDSAAAGGDVPYPDHLEANNAADLIQLQIGLDRAGDIVVRAVLETLVEPDVPVVGVGFDVDTDAATGAAELPGGRWPVAGRLGVETLLEISSLGARWWQWAGGTWVPGERLAATVDAAENTLTTTVDGADLPGDRWRVVAAVGIDGGAGSWLEGGADVYDLAFVGSEPFVRWQNNLQADILAGVLDAGLAVAEIDATMLERRATTLDDALEPGFHTLLYRSELRLAEGVESDQSGSPIFLGPYQPYLLWIPEEMPEPTPLSLFLHGSDQNHLGAVFQQPGDFYIGTGRALSEDPHLIETLGFAGDGFDFPPHMLQAYPLARGGRLGYRGIAHQDVLDVLADVERRFDVDPDRIILQGASMGGIGTYRLATLQPDRWSVALPLIGFQSESLLPLSVNLRNLPVRQINGAADPLIPVAPADASAARLDELGYDYRYWLLRDRGHEAGGFVYDCVFQSAVDFVRQRHPAIVTFVVDASLDEVDEEAGLDLRFDSAYWLSSIRPRDDSSPARVDAVSFALPLYTTEARRIDRTVDNSEMGADLCGLNPNLNTGDEWRERGIQILLLDEAQRRNLLDATLQNVGAIGIEVSAAGIDAGSRADFIVATDGPVTVSLRGLAAGQSVVVGTEEIRADESGVAVVDLLESGTELFELLPR